MLNLFLGAGIFLFSASLALNVYSYSLLRRSINVLQFSLKLLDCLKRNDEPFRKEGTD